MADDLPVVPRADDAWDDQVTKTRSQIAELQGQLEVAEAEKTTAYEEYTRCNSVVRQLQQRLEAHQLAFRSLLDEAAVQYGGRPA